jgi:hypothetical protein
MSLHNKQSTPHLQKIVRWLPGKMRPSRRRPLRSQVVAGLFSTKFASRTDSYDKQNAWFARPTIDEAITGLTGIPERCALLGIGEDDLPILLDLTNPSTGAILVISENGGGKTALLRSILFSASQLNKPDQIKLRMIADQPDEYHDLSACLQDVLPVEGPANGDLITNLVQTIESRKQTGPQDPTSILIIDDLPALLTFLDEKSFNELYWLIRHGPRYRVWTAAALPSSKVKQIDPRFLSAFRTRLFGFMHDERLASRLAYANHIPTRRLERSHQFLYPSNGDWLRFWVCRESDTLGHQEAISSADEKGDL